MIGEIRSYLADLEHFVEALLGRRVCMLADLGPRLAQAVETVSLLQTVATLEQTFQISERRAQSLFLVGHLLKRLDPLVDLGTPGLRFRAARSRS